MGHIKKLCNKLLESNAKDELKNNKDWIIFYESFLIGENSIDQTTLGGVDLNVDSRYHLKFNFSIEEVKRDFREFLGISDDIIIEKDEEKQEIEK